MSKQKHPINEIILKHSINRAVDREFINRHPKEEVEKEINKAKLVEQIVFKVKENCKDSASFYKRLLEVSRALECIASEYQGEHFVKGKIYSGEFDA